MADPIYHPNAVAFTTIRTLAGLTIPELAERARIGRNTLWKIENGRVVPRESTVRAVADALGVPISSLYTTTLRAPATTTAGAA